jgi:hypothetical protein
MRIFPPLKSLGALGVPVIPVDAHPTDSSYTSTSPCVTRIATKKPFKNLSSK